MKLSLLIPTLPDRKHLLERLVYNLEWQIENCSNPNEVEILPFEDNGELSTGIKSNILMMRATGEAVARVDDDDMINDCYVQKGIDFAKSGKDCASLIGLYFLNGVYDRPFLHSIKYKEWSQDEKYYYRTINHLNFVRRDLVKDILYPDKTVGEDHSWSKKIRESGVLKTEFQVKETLYLYYAKR